MRKKKKYEEIQDKNKPFDDEKTDQKLQESKAETEEKITPENGKRMKAVLLVGGCAALIIAIAVLANAAGKVQVVARKQADNAIAQTDSGPEAGEHDKNPNAFDDAEKSTDKRVKEDGNIKKDTDESAEEKKEQPEGSNDQKTHTVKEEKQEKSSVPDTSITSDKPQPVVPPETEAVEEPSSVPDPAAPSIPPTENVSTPVSSAASAGNNEAPKVIAAEEPAVHTHTWVEKIRTIHHDAVTEQIKVIDQEAYVEPIYETVPVFEQIPKYICHVCGEEFGYPKEHSTIHIDWETLTNPFSYHVEFVQGEQIGTEVVQIGSRTYPEKSHMETVVLQEAYDDVLSEGYVCSGCGAIKL